MQNEFLSLVYDLHNCGFYNFFLKIKFTVTFVDILFDTCQTYHYILSNLQLIAMYKVLLTFHHKIIIIKKVLFITLKSENDDDDDDDNNNNNNNVFSFLFNLKYILVYSEEVNKNLIQYYIRRSLLSI